MYIKIIIISLARGLAFFLRDVENLPLIFWQLNVVDMEAKSQTFSIQNGELSVHLTKQKYVIRGVFSKAP
jgi:hypothetical protein